MPTSQFLKDRRRGKPAQKFVADIYRSFGLKVDEVPDGYFPGYDLEVDGEVKGQNLHFKVEVKYDLWFEKSRNFCLELDALSHSKAGILCYVVNDPSLTAFQLDLQPTLKFAQSWKPLKPLGERGELCALVPEQTFKSHLNPLLLRAKKEALAF